MGQASCEQKVAMAAGARLTYLRGLSGLTREELARASGVGKRTIQRAEAGDEKVTSETHQRLLDALEEVGVKAEKRPGLFFVDHKMLTAWKAQRRQG